MVKKIKDMDLEVFVDKLLEDKKLPEGLSQDVLNEMKKDLLKMVESRINATILANLSEDQMNEFSDLLDSDDEIKIQKYLENAIPDLAQILASELIVFKQIYLG